MRFQLSMVVVVSLTAFATPSIARAQRTPVAPAQLLVRRDELSLTPQQVRELSLLASQARRFQQALLLAPSKPWIAGSRGWSADEASRRAFALLSLEQREIAARPDGAGPPHP